MLTRALTLAFLATVVACSASSSDGQTGDEQDIKAGGLPPPPATETLKDVKVDQAKLRWGLDGSYYGQPQQVAGVHAFTFDGEDGDEVSATSHSQTGGTMYVLQKSADGFTVVGKSALVKSPSGNDGKVDVTLHAAGTYAIAFEPSFTPAETSAPHPWFQANVTLEGKPKSDANKLMLDVRHQYVSALENDPHALWTAADSAKLPKQALAQFNAWTKQFEPDYPAQAYSWTVDGQQVWVVENMNDGGMYIAFYDAKGNELAGGGAGESEEFGWNE